MIQFLLFTLLSASSVFAAIPTLTFMGGDNLALKVEVLSDDFIHFEVATKKFHSSQNNKAIITTPMIDKKSGYPGPTSLKKYSQGFETSLVKVGVGKDLCISLLRKKDNKKILKTCPYRFEQSYKRLYSESFESQNFYGLGHNFYSFDTDGDLKKRHIRAGGEYGNSLKGFSKGANGASIFPILYSLEKEGQGYFFFFDHYYKQEWKFNNHLIKGKEVPFFDLDFLGEQTRWYVKLGDSPKELKRAYMDLVGKSKLPPKKALGLWVSEFGFDSFKETFDILRSIRNDNFPLDGFGMDIQWFGGRFIQDGVFGDSKFGALEWDRGNFKDPEKTIEHLHQEHGVDLMLIEESYVSKYLPIHDVLEKKGYLAKNSDGSATFLDSNPWWGKGGMIDWTNPDAGNFFHDLKRQPLIDMGVTYHWTDLGEPEMYNGNSKYYGFPETNKHDHKDIHNYFNFAWLESIARGYERNQVRTRPFMMSRSGAPGIQKLGAAMWSGDIGANLNAFKASLNVQMHLSMSGIDYYGNDIGGFHRRSDTLDGSAEKLFTLWFANASVFDFPVRSHTWNLSNSLQTSPNLIGDKNSNYFNIHQRYALSAYYYSLAKEVSETGDPLVRPLFYEFPSDLEVREIANQKMIGKWLMGAAVANYGEADRRVYLPAGTWMNYHTAHIYESKGEHVQQITNHQNGIFRIPLFLKQGAIVPKMNVDKDSYNILGKRRKGSKRLDDLSLLIFPSPKKSEFTLYEDDGETIDYEDGKFATTEISQIKNGNEILIEVSPAIGEFSHQIKKRNLRLEVVLNEEQVAVVLLDEKQVKRCNVGEWESRKICYQIKENKVEVQTSETSILKKSKLRIQTRRQNSKTTSALLVCYNGITVPGQSIYMVGNHPVLGNGDDKLALRLNPTDYPVWSSFVKNLPRNLELKYRCVKKTDGPENQSLEFSEEFSFELGQRPYSGKAAGWF